MKDPIIEEVRRIRDAHSKSFNYNLDAICENYKSSQKKLKNRLVRLKPQLIVANNALHTGIPLYSIPAGEGYLTTV